jgi:hypothetical protein
MHNIALTVSQAFDDLIISVLFHRKY